MPLNRSEPFGGAQHKIWIVSDSSTGLYIFGLSKPTTSKSAPTSAAASTADSGIAGVVGAGGRAKRVEDGSVGRPRFVMHNLWGCFTQCFKDFVRYLSDLAS